MSSDLVLADAEATAALARRIAPFLQAGDLVTLDGPMGAGKTTFTRALVAALGGDPAVVASPTYTLLHHYEARLPVVHVDACRLSSAEELEGLGFSEAAAPGVAVVEWAEQVEEALSGRRWSVSLDHDGAGGRRARVLAPPDAAWSADPVIRIPAAHGRDPLVGQWLATHASRSALRFLQGPWILAGALAGLAGALALAGIHSWPGFPATFRRLAEAWLGDPAVVLPGAILGAGLVALVAARRPIPAGQEPWLGLGGFLILWSLLWDPLMATGVLASGIALIFVLAVGYRVLAVLLGGQPGLSVVDPQPPVGGWPRVSILVPLYQEAEIVPGLLANLRALDYPPECLEILFLCEADDPATVAALAAGDLPPRARVVVVPDAQPKTKPRACNHGLVLATAEFLVIYDAEDRPEPDQIRQAVAVFGLLPLTTACLQAHLAWHNAGTNVLTRLFALEYNVWFRRYLPGLHRLGAPIPLGGTSNHFRTAILRQVGGWDPFNVAEDCDLGMRLHQAGYRTDLLDRTTWEESVTDLGPWIRQRTRWFKGYLATWAVWGRQPLTLARRLGPAGTLGFLLVVPAVPLLAGLGLVLWLVLMAYAGLVGIDVIRGHDLLQILGTRDWAGERWSWPLWYAGPAESPVWSTASQILAVVSGGLVLGNLLLVILSMAGGGRPDQRGLRLWGLLIPGYWVLQGVAAWRALLHAIIQPHRWEKTVHHRQTPPE